ncbi:MAG: pyridoxal 5'-phosphate synthase glutaminase subunit PdxT [Euryarchaeota archaeon]|nr:pyridoxal 5'-phosphate synthase glutaminase subunit PdxT [Euryarchaeota archaeon]
MLRIGLVMLQGARRAHIDALNLASDATNIPIEIFELRKSEDLELCNPDAIILPGGESTTMRLTGNSKHSNLFSNLFDYMIKNPSLPVLGTCAGAIILANPGGKNTSFVDAKLNRNAYGNQSDSFQSTVFIKLFNSNFPGIFIRAPRFTEIGPEADVIAEINSEVVGVRTKNRVALAFHPELSDNPNFHIWLLEKSRENKSEMKL